MKHSKTYISSHIHAIISSPQSDCWMKRGMHFQIWEYWPVRVKRPCSHSWDYEVNVLCSQAPRPMLVSAVNEDFNTVLIFALYIYIEQLQNDMLNFIHLSIVKFSEIPSYWLLYCLFYVLVLSTHLLVCISYYECSLIVWLLSPLSAIHSHTISLF